MSTNCASDLRKLTKVPFTSNAYGQPSGATCCSVIFSPGIQPISINFNASKSSEKLLMVAVSPLTNWASVFGKPFISYKGKGYQAFFGYLIRGIFKRSSDYDIGHFTLIFCDYAKGFLCQSPNAIIIFKKKSSFLFLLFSCRKQHIIQY